MKYVLGTIVIFVVIVGFIMNSNRQEYQISRGEQLVNITLSNSSKLIKQKYNIDPCGSGAAMPGGPIQVLTLAFTTKGPYNQDELRKLLLSSSNDLVNQVTQNSEMQQYLKNPPFTIKNVQIIIYNHDKNGGSVYDPEILTAGISNGFLTYRTIESDKNFRMKNQYKESYEEALQMSRG